MGSRAVASRKKNARRRRALIVFQDESGISQRPSVRRTWAPRGHTPVLVHAASGGVNITKNGRFENHRTIS